MKAKYKTELAQEYGVHVNTMCRWLKKIPGLKLDIAKRKLTIPQLKIIYQHLGPPN